MAEFLMTDAVPRHPLAATALGVAKLAPLVLSVSLLAAGLAYVALLPERYVATATIELPQGADYESEVSRIFSQPVLGLAATRLAPALVAELRQTAAESVDITALLERSVQVSKSADASVFSLASVARNPTSALGLANGLVDAYLYSATAPSLSLSNVGSERLLPHSVPDVAPVDEKRQTLEDRLAAARMSRISLQARADQADALLEQANFYALAREFDSFGTMVTRVQNLADLQGERDLLSATLLSSHPKMRNLVERIAALTRQLQGEGQELADAARGGVVAAQRAEAQLVTELESLPAASSGSTAAALIDTTMTGAIPTAPAKLVSFNIQPLQKLIAPALGAGASGALAFLAQILLLLRRRAKGNHGSAVHEPLELSGPADAEQLPAAMTETVTATQTAATLVLEEAPASAPHRGTEKTVQIKDEPIVASRALGSRCAVPARKVAARKLPIPQIVIIGSGLSVYHSQRVACELAGALTKQGKSVAVVDAGSRLRTAAAGISDLAAGRAVYADVVQFDEDQALTTVSWGRRASLRLDAEPVPILIAALGALSDFVIVVTGNVSLQERQVLLSMPGARDWAA